MGPFVDSDHPEIKKGTANNTFEDIFSVEIIARVCSSIFLFVLVLSLNVNPLFFFISGFCKKGPRLCRIHGFCCPGSSFAIHA